MTRLIDADAVIEDAFDLMDRNELLEDVPQIIKDYCDAQPTVDAEPVRHGKWIKIHPQGIYECSECHQNVMTSNIECYRYCHQCGARMGVEHDNS